MKSHEHVRCQDIHTFAFVTHPRCGKNSLASQYLSSYIIKNISEYMTRVIKIKNEHNIRFNLGCLKVRIHYTVKDVCISIINKFSDLVIERFIHFDMKKDIKFFELLDETSNSHPINLNTLEKPITLRIPYNALTYSLSKYTVLDFIKSEESIIRTLKTTFAPIALTHTHILISIIKCVNTTCLNHKDLNSYEDIQKFVKNIALQCLYTYVEN